MSSNLVGLPVGEQLLIFWVDIIQFVYQLSLFLDILSTVRIKLASKTTTETVRDIMKAFDFPREALEKEISTKLRGWGDSLSAFGEDKHKYASFMGNLNVGIFHTKVVKLTLEKWIDENQKAVAKNQLNSERMQLSSGKILTDLKTR